MKALVDYDVIRYAVGFAAEGEPIENCLHSVKLMINDIVEATEATQYVGYLTGQGNFREKIATIRPYKGNRPGIKPTHYDAIGEYLLAHHGAVIVSGEEADDAMGIAQFADFAEKRAEEPLETIICTIDKDLNMIPGWHYNWKRKEKYFVTMDDADKFFYTQLLTGDTTDNIQGVPGIGAKRASTIINSCASEEDMYWAVLCEYSKKYERPMEALLENAQLLWIRRYPQQEWLPWF